VWVRKSPDSAVLGIYARHSPTEQGRWFAVARNGARYLIDPPLAFARLEAPK